MDLCSGTRYVANNELRSIKLLVIGPVPDTILQLLTAHHQTSLTVISRQRANTPSE